MIVFTGNDMKRSGDCTLSEYSGKDDSARMQRTLCSVLEKLNIVVLDLQQCPGTAIHFVTAFCCGPRTAAFQRKLCASLTHMGCVMVDMEEGQTTDLHSVKIISFEQFADRRGE